MVKIWCQKLSENRSYNPNFPIDRDLGFEWRQYLFANKSIPFSKLSFKISEDIIDNDFLEGESIPIVSEKIRNILIEEVSEFVDFYPVSIFDGSKQVNTKKLYVIKIKNEVSCFDWDKSDYEVCNLTSGVKEILAVNNLILIEDKIKDQLIFKVSEFNGFLVGVREDLCKKILDSEAKGIEFKDMNEILM